MRWTRFEQREKKGKATKNKNKISILLPTTFKAFVSGITVGFYFVVVGNSGKKELASGIKFFYWENGKHNNNYNKGWGGGNPVKLFIDRSLPVFLCDSAMFSVVICRIFCSSLQFQSKIVVGFDLAICQAYKLNLANLCAPQCLYWMHLICLHAFELWIFCNFVMFNWPQAPGQNFQRCSKCVEQLSSVLFSAHFDRTELFWTTKAYSAFPNYNGRFNVPQWATWKNNDLIKSHRKSYEKKTTFFWGLGWKRFGRICFIETMRYYGVIF